MKLLVICYDRSFPGLTERAFTAFQLWNLNLLNLLSFSIIVAVFICCRTDIVRPICDSNKLPHWGVHIWLCQLKMGIFSFTSS